MAAQRCASARCRSEMSRKTAVINLAGRIRGTVEQFAEQQNLPAWAVIIDTDQGDLGAFPYPAMGSSAFVEGAAGGRRV